MIERTPQSSALSNDADVVGAVQKGTVRDGLVRHRIVSRRRRGRVALLMAVAAAVGMLAVGCGDDSGGTELGGTPTTTASTTVSSTSPETSTTTGDSSSTSSSGPVDTTAPATTTSTDTPSVTADVNHCAEAGSSPTNPEPAAQAVFIAWTRGDRDCAAALMTPAALGELFARDGTGATDDFQLCSEVNEPDPAFDCAFTYEGGATHYTMVFSPTAGWQVTDVYQVAD